MFVFALAVFMWGIVKFIRHSGTGENMDEGKQSMVWGVVGMLIMVSVYGIIFFVLNTFHLGPSGGSGFGY